MRALFLIKSSRALTDLVVVVVAVLYSNLLVVA